MYENENTEGNMVSIATNHINLEVFSTIYLTRKNITHIVTKQWWKIMYVPTYALWKIK